MTGTTLVVLAQSLGTDAAVDGATILVGFAILAGGVGGLTAFVYRWYVREEIPEGIAILLGLSIVAVLLNTLSALGDAIIGETPLLDPMTAIFTVVAFVASAIAADIGRRVGDRFATDLGVRLPATGARGLQDVGEVVRAAGRVVTIDFPEQIDDIDGYDPVDPATKKALSGSSLVVPRYLSTEGRRERIVSRLRDDYGVGHVALEFGPEETIQSLAIGSRVAGIGPQLEPGTAAVAIRADPAYTASPGDTVEVWATDSPQSTVHPPLESTAPSNPGPDQSTGIETAPENADHGAEQPGDRPSDSSEHGRVATGELLASIDDVVTLAVDEAVVDVLDPAGTYRLVTRPASTRTDRELLSLLRHSSEIVAAIEVPPDGPLANAAVGSLEVSVLAAQTGTEELELISSPDHLCRPGETVYVLGEPAEIRRLDGDRTQQSGGAGLGDRARKS